MECGWHFFTKATRCFISANWKTGNEALFPVFFQKIGDKKMHFGGFEPGPLDQGSPLLPSMHSKALEQC